MSEHKRSLPSKEELREYTLFIDRDGVINQPRINDYAKKPEEFEMIPGSSEALKFLKTVFYKVILITNQQGIHKKIMTEQDLENVHLKMLKELKSANAAYFDAAFFAPYLKKKEHTWRKPRSGMLEQAFTYFPDLDKSKLIVVGDAPTDMELADNMGAIKVKIKNKQFSFENEDFVFNNLGEFAAAVR